MNRRWRLRLYWVSTFAWAFFLSRGAFAMLLNVSDVIAQSCNPVYRRQVWHAARKDKGIMKTMWDNWKQPEPKKVMS